MAFPRPLVAAFALSAVLALTPTTVAPPAYAFSVTIYQPSPSGGPLVTPLPPGCLVTSPPSLVSLTVECTAPPGFTCDQTFVQVLAGTVWMNGTSPQVDYQSGWIPGEYATGKASCTNGPTATAVAPMTGVAYGATNSVNSAFPWTCQASFTPAATGMVTCWTP